MGLTPPHQAVMSSRCEGWESCDRLQLQPLLTARAPAQLPSTAMPSVNSAHHSLQTMGGLCKDMRSVFNFPGFHPKGSPPHAFCPVP